MRTYTLHLPPGTAHARGEDAARAIEAARIVPDGFSWGAFLFTVLWCLRHRLVLAAVGVACAFLALWGLSLALHLTPGVAGLAGILLSLLVGLEASSLRRWTYARQGSPTADVVTARDAEDAELRFLARSGLTMAAAAPVSIPASPGPRASSPRAGDDGIFGLFPEAEGRR